MTLLEVLGVIAFALSGGAVAVRCKMDWLGVIVLTVVSAVGGGTLRDILLGNTPVWWVNEAWPIAVAGAVAIVVIAVGHRVPHVSLDSPRAVLIADAGGLAAFSVSGALAAHAAGVPAWSAVVFGVLTGSGGGVIRDLLAMRRPLIFGGQIYALAALAGSATTVVLAEVESPADVTRWVGVAVTFALRLMAMQMDWQLPKFDESTRISN